MDDKFIKDRISDDDIQVPDSLLPENIGNLLNKAEMKKLQKRKKHYTGWIYSFAGAVAAILMLILVVNVTGISKDSKNGENTAGGNTAVTYEDIYRQLDGGIWRKIQNSIYSVKYGAVSEWDLDYVVTESETMAAAIQDTNVQANLAVTDGASENTGNYSRTNIQEENVGEGDIFITDGSYIYILKGRENYYGISSGEVVIARADGENVTTISDFFPETMEGYDTLRYREMYVSDDRLAIVGTALREIYVNNNDDEVTFVSVYDISDRSNPVFINTVRQSGSYVSSRRNNGILYLVSEFDRLADISRREYDSYIPACDGQTVDAGSIYCPEELYYRGYTVIGSIDLSNPQGYIDSESIMADNSNMYVSNDAIYFLINTGDIKTYNILGSTLYGKSMSNLVKFSYKDGNIEYVNTAEVPGNADSQFSFSEYKGYLRIVTTAREYVQYADTNEAARALDEKWNRNATYAYGGTTSSGLYIFDENLNMTGSIDNLAEGEFLKSSRFLGDMAYFVTFRQTDPLFTVDVSDPSNPIITNELKVTGFSEYLHPYSDGKMLGIGYEADPYTGARGYIKLSMFDISDSGDVTEENRLVLEGAYYAGALYEHRAVMVDAGRGLFGFASNFDFYSGDAWTGGGMLYQLFTYDENDGFKILISCRVDDKKTGNSYDYGSESSRAVYIDDYLYIYDGENFIYIYDLTDYSFVKDFSIEE